jgi:DNA-binding NarL/FixJ family response regulator
VALSRLSAREKEVLRLIAQGFSTKEIAGTLNISFKTAVTHRTHLLRKLQLHESASLVRIAIRAGLVAA